MRRKILYQLIAAGVIIVGLIVIGLQLMEYKNESKSAEENQPVVVENQKGEKLNHVILSENAAKNIGIQTDKVQPESDGWHMTIPYSAVIYDPDGNAWTYTNPKRLTFMRQTIVIDRIDGSMAILSDGPPVGTVVVTVGAAELYGAETGVGD